MLNVSRNDIMFTVAMVAAVWFAWMGMLWLYWGALFLAYPFGILSLVLWFKIRDEQKARTKYIPIVLAFGLFLSLAALAYYLITD